MLLFCIFVKFRKKISPRVHESTSPVLVLYYISKSFDRVGDNFILRNTLDLNFLCERGQRVKIGETFSSWLPVAAGVPQKTKLDQILLITSSYNLTSNSPSAFQSTLDDINS